MCSNLRIQGFSLQRSIRKYDGRRNLHNYLLTCSQLSNTPVPHKRVKNKSFAQMAFESSKRTYPCADCREPHTAMKHFSPTWPDLEYKTPETIAEAIGNHTPTGKRYRKICPACELKRRVQWVNEYQNHLPKGRIRVEGKAVVGVTQGG